MLIAECDVVGNNHTVSIANLRLGGLPGSANFFQHQVPGLYSDVEQLS